MRVLLLVCVALGLLRAQEPSPVTHARQLTVAGKLGEAEALLRDTIAGGADSAEVHGELGGLLYRSNRLRESVPELGRAAQLDPKNATYSMQLAGALIGDHRYSVGLDYLKAVQG